MVEPGSSTKGYTPERVYAFCAGLKCQKGKKVDEIIRVLRPLTKSTAFMEKRKTSGFKTEMSHAFLARYFFTKSGNTILSLTKQAATPSTKSRSPAMMPQ